MFAAISRYPTGKHEINFDLSPKKKKYSVYFMLLTLSGRSFIKIQYSSLPLFPEVYPFRIATQLQYYVKREKCKVSDVIFPSGCEARAINLGNKNVNIGIFTGATSVRSKNIFTDISRYPTGKHEIIIASFFWGGCPLKVQCGEKIRVNVLSSLILIYTVSKIWSH